MTATILRTPARHQISVAIHNPAPDGSVDTDREPDEVRAVTVYTDEAGEVVTSDADIARIEAILGENDGTQAAG